MNQIDKEILELREEKKVLQSLDRLMINEDFKRVILEDYIQRHSVDLNLSKGRLSLDPQTLLDIDRQLDAIALLNMYLASKHTRLADIDIEIVEAETLREQQTTGNI